MAAKPSSRNVARDALLDPAVRKALVRKSHYWFFHYYFAHYIQFKTAPFQKEIFLLTEHLPKVTVVEAFRFSGKSTLLGMSLPLWAVLGAPEKKYVLIIGKTQAQARQYLKNIKDEIEGNENLRRDLGPFREEEDEWRAQSIVIPKVNARISVASVESSLRGLRNREHRPDLVIADDLEDLESVRQQEQRDQLYKWYTGDVLPMGSVDAAFVVIGTRLHDDSLIMRLRRDIVAGKLRGVVKLYPLLDECGAPLWPGRFPSAESVEELKMSVPDDATFQREYMLRIVSDENRIVHPEWIKRYGIMPERNGNPMHQCTLIGVDLAISERDSADYTAMVSVSIFRDREDRWTAYVHPNPVNKRLDYPTSRERIKALSLEMGNNIPVTAYIESVGYQISMVQDLLHEGFPAAPFDVHGQDKRSRLALVTHLIKEGIVRFPENGCELLENQLIGFGTEKHDDLADAFAIALHQVLRMITMPTIVIPKDRAIVRDESYEAELREIDLRFSERKFEYQQGRMDQAHFFACEEKRRDCIRSLNKREAERQRHEAQKRASERNAAYELSVYNGLMQHRLR